MPTKNPVALWLREFRKHQPAARPADAWQHLTRTVPAHVGYPWLIEFDEAAGELRYRPALWLDERRMNFSAFRKMYQRAKRAG